MRDDPQAVAAVRVLTDVPLHNCARLLCFAFLLCAVLFFQKKKNTSLFFFSLFFYFNLIENILLNKTRRNRRKIQWENLARKDQRSKCVRVDEYFIRLDEQRKNKSYGKTNKIFFLFIFWVQSKILKIKTEVNYIVYIDREREREPAGAKFGWRMSGGDWRRPPVRGGGDDRTEARPCLRDLQGRLMSRGHPSRWMSIHRPYPFFYRCSFLSLFPVSIWLPLHPELE